MKRKGLSAAVAAIAALGVAGALLWMPPPRGDLSGWDAKPGSPPVRAAAVGSLSVMTYNVEGLPPPARWGRGGELREIGKRLAAMRRVGRAPDVVLLQEAFVDPRVPIEELAGYRYTAHGPSAAEVDHAPPPDAGARALADGASLLKGEGAGKWLGSGLRIMSDFPIVATRRRAFPAWMCAGYDCLANKGVLIAWIAVPGSARPVAFVNTHLQSMRKAGVPPARSDAAYALQVQAMRAFVKAHVPRGEAAFFAGDFDTENAARRALLAAPPLDGGRNALAQALDGEGIVAAGDLAEARAVRAHGVDWLYYRGRADWPVRLTGLSVPFGADAQGAMLSDHRGYVARFRVGQASRDS